MYVVLQHKSMVLARTSLAYG